MAINAKKLESITESELQEMIGERESKTLEFKEQLIEKDKLLAAVSSFANAVGGDLILGVKESDGQAQEIVGLALDDVDAEIRRLDNLFRDYIEPRIPGLRIHSVSLQNGRIVLIIRIPRSWALPHCLKSNSKESFKFFSRNSAGKYPLDLGELRSLFALTDSRAERLRQFRTERLSRIIAGETPVPLNEGAKMVLHLLPWGAFDPGTSVNLSQQKGKIDMWRPLDAYGYSHVGYNFDGLYTRSGSTGIAQSYLQLFRNGCVETATTSLAAEGVGEKAVLYQAYEQSLLEAVKQLRELQQHFGIEPPSFIALSLLGVKGFTIEAMNATRFRTQTHIDRNDLIVPEILVETFAFDPAEIMRPAFDAVWNAAGWERSMNYDEQGQWRYGS